MVVNKVRHKKYAALKGDQLWCHVGWRCIHLFALQGRGEKESWNGEGHPSKVVWMMKFTLKRRWQKKPNVKMLQRGSKTVASRVQSRQWLLCMSHVQCLGEWIDEFIFVSLLSWWIRLLTSLKGDLMTRWHKSEWLASPVASISVPHKALRCA